MNLNCFNYLSVRSLSSLKITLKKQLRESFDTLYQFVFVVFGLHRYFLKARNEK